MMGTSESVVASALELMSGGVYVMTASFEGKKAGATVRSAMPCATEPLLLCVASRKGHGIEPIIRDSRHFRAASSIPPIASCPASSAVCHGRPTPWIDFPIETLVSGSPVIKRSLLAFDCEVVRHFDMEADHELYVGRILAARIYAIGLLGPPAG